MIVSIHTPKAGGTSTRKTLEKAFGIDAVYSDCVDDPSDPESRQYANFPDWMETRPDALPRKVQVVHGHFHPLKYARLADVFWTTILRHPVSNIVSIYNYWLSIPPQPHSLHLKFKRNPVNLLEFAKIETFRYLYTKTYFGGWDMGSMNFVGSHENRTRDLQTLGEMLGVAFETDLHANDTEDWGMKFDRNIDANTHAALSDILAEDIAFYQEHVVS